MSKSLRKFPDAEKCMSFLFLKARDVFWKFRGRPYQINVAPKFALESATQELKKFDGDHISLIDLGCNSGALIFALWKEFPNVIYTGVDIQSAAITMAKKESALRSGSFNWIESNIKSLFFFKRLRYIGDFSNIDLFKSRGTQTIFHASSSQDKAYFNFSRDYLINRTSV